MAEVAASGLIVGAGALSATPLRIRAATGTIAAASAVEAAAGVLRKASGTIAGVSTFSEPVAVRFWWPLLEVYVDEAGEEKRRISWDITDLLEEVEVRFDGVLFNRVVGGEMNVPADVEIRQYIDIWDEPPRTITTPLDKVSLDWTATSAKSQVWRRVDGGDWELVATIKADVGDDLTYASSVLEDADYDYKVLAEDDEGDTAASAVVSLTVESAPEPPSNFAVAEAE